MSEGLWPLQPMALGMRQPELQGAAAVTSIPRASQQAAQGPEAEVAFLPSRGQSESVPSSEQGHPGRSLWGGAQPGLPEDPCSQDRPFPQPSSTTPEDTKISPPTWDPWLPESMQALLGGKQGTAPPSMGTWDRRGTRLGGGQPSIILHVLRQGWVGRSWPPI